MAQFALIGLIGLGLLLLVWHQNRKARASMSWPAVLGRVISVKVGSETRQGDADNPDSTVFFPEVEYEYQLDSGTYRGRTFSIEPRTYSKPGPAEKALAAFPPGSPVQVYYDPRKPSTAILQRKRSAGIVPLALGGLIVAIDIAAAFAR